MRWPTPSTITLLVVVAIAWGRSDPSDDAPGGVDGDGGSSGQDGQGAESSDLPKYTDFDINHVLITGQSNSVSNGGNPELSTEQPFGNLMFDTGVMSMQGGFDDPSNHASARKSSCDSEGCTSYQNPKSFVPLVEGDNYYDYKVETSASGLANQVSSLVKEKYIGKVRNLPSKHDVLVSLHGRSGNTYQCLRKGGCNYKADYFLAFEQGMREVTDAKAVAASLGKSYVVRAVAAIHGESDHYSYTSGTTEFPLAGTDGTADKIADYSDGVVEWQRDYETEIKKITGQKEPVFMFISQISGWNDSVTSKVAQFQLDAHVKAAGKVFLIGPSYQLPIASDCLHYTNEGERRLGEYFAKAYARVIFEGQPWEPVRPKTIMRDGAVITVVFHVPKPPLAFDTELVAPADNQGFTFDDGAETKITNVELTGPDTVEIMLDKAPVGANARLRYAMNQTPGTCIGTPQGARGNLRDSDDTKSRNGYDLHNWAVHFDLAVP